MFFNFNGWFEIAIIIICTFSELVNPYKSETLMSYQFTATIGFIL